MISSCKIAKVSLTQLLLFAPIFRDSAIATRPHKLTLLWSRIQHCGGSHQLLQHFIALFAIWLLLRLFLLAKRFNEGSDFGLEAGALVLAEGVNVQGELVGEFGEGTLDQEGGSRSGHNGRR
jgi:hypothetical protein